MIRKSVVFFILCLALGCAKAKERPLPGDSVTDDGGVTLSPPRSSTPATQSESTNAANAPGPIEARLFPPELAMEHQEELGITEEQKNALIAETERGNREVLRLQWDLEAEKEKLVKLLEPDKVDEAKVKDAASRVTDREGKVKAAYLTMLVRVKNILTSEQQQKLRDHRAQEKKPPHRALDAGTHARRVDGGS